MRKASPDAFDNYLGKDRAAVIAEAIETLLSEDERLVLASPTPVPDLKVITEEASSSVKRMTET